MDAKRLPARAAAHDPAPRLTAALLVGVLALMVLAVVGPLHGATAAEHFDVLARR